MIRIPSQQLLVRLTRLGILALLGTLLLSCATPTSTPIPTRIPPTVAPAPTLTEVPPTVTATPTSVPPTATATVTSTPPATLPPATPTAKPIACNFTIDPNTRTLDGAGDFATIKPGSIVCIPAGNRKGLRLLNFKGTAEAPIVFINSGGKVFIDAANNNGGVGIQLYGSQHVRITGSGDPAIPYGIEIANGSNAGIDTNRASPLNATDATEYVEIDHIYAHNIGAGIRTAKNNDLLETTTPWSGHQYYIHDNYIKTTTGEAMYIGTSDNYGSWPIYDVQVYNNRIEDAGYDGIQVRQAHTKVLVYNNYINGTGRNPCKNGSIDNTAGFNIASMTDTGDWYNNTVIGARKAFWIKDAGGVRIYNNLIIDSGHATSGLNDPECPPGVTSTAPEGAVYLWNANNVQFFFNTVVNAQVKSVYGINMRNATGLIRDNIIGGSFDNLIAGSGMTVSGNLTNNDLAFFGFVDPGKMDFRLTRNSPAVNAASESAPSAVDKDGNKRPQGSKPSVGAYEYH